MVQQNENYLSRSLSHGFRILSTSQPTIQCVKFKNQASLTSHYAKHVTIQNDAGSAYANENDYANAAISIVTDGDAGNANVQLKTGANGKKYYLNTTTSQFVATDGSGNILTMFVPSSDPQVYFSNQP